MSKGLVPRTKDDPIRPVSNIAANRVREHLMKLDWIEFDLKQFGINCYMQGLEDMSESIIRNPQKVLGTLMEPIPEQETILDFNI